ncbi:hypothetical protein U5801_26230 [Lamprobacter modestohalophilus]|uniref:hypothetical protein n=1 Tax=Lamprobacter modestohalophilus TaxID=1064514 RepID=UPI002ADEC51F|nr:hypothetical protein [Lamprobacter modestohalophilus]MEA1053274.1 hypothetical protein [Lamprobacter modestohalophilus]
MTLDDVLRDIHAMREDLLVFERKFGVPTEMFYEAYCNGEEPADSSWVLDWSEWAAAYQILQERMELFGNETRRLLQSAQVSSYIDLMERTARHESIPIAG